MYQVRFHGRGGQGVVTAAELLSYASFIEGHHAQAFPSFGSERMGAPVAAFCRIDDQNPIRLREPIAEPDALIVQDPTLVRNADLLTGIENAKIVIINSRLDFDQLNAPQLKSRISRDKILLIPATEIALEIIKRNVPNVIMLAAFGAVTGLFSFETLDKAVAHKFPAKIAQANMLAAEKTWNLVKKSTNLEAANA